MVGWAPAAASALRFLPQRDNVVCRMDDAVDQRRELFERVQLLGTVLPAIVDSLHAGNCVGQHPFRDVRPHADAVIRVFEPLCV
jgi:hypothetical protein